MKARVAIKTDFIELLARLIRAENDNPKSRSGSDLTCSQPTLGRWIQECDVPFLMETLELVDSVFNEEFPGIRLTQDERKLFAKTLVEHCRECARCHAKQAEDTEWKLKVERAFAENKQTIGEVLIKPNRKP